MKKYTVITILILLACIVIGLYIYGIVVDGADPMDRLLATVGVVCTCAAGCIRAVGVSHNHTLKFYEEQYQDVVRDAFVNDAKNRKTLLKILRDFNDRKYEKCIRKLNVLKKNCERTPEHYVVNLFIALSYTRLKQLNKAEEQYLYMINRGLGDSRVFSNVGNLQIDMGKYESAIQNFNFAIDRDSKNPYAYNNLAQAHFEMYELDKAIEYATIATQIDPKLEAAASLLAIIYGLKNDQENYDKYYHFAIAAGSSPAKILQTIAYYRSSQG